MRGSQDLRVTKLSTKTLHPSESTERRSMYLSNIDQVLNFSVETIQFFKANSDYPVVSIFDTLQSAVERLLVQYDFLAGRLRFNGSKGRMEIDCNDAGVMFVVATSELELADLDKLEYPNLAYRQLTLAAEEAGGSGLEDRPLCAFQVTSFKCDGFTIGISRYHSALDGISLQYFLKNLAALAFNKPLPIPPFNDRRLLAPRSPPCVMFSHPELLKLETLPFPPREEQLPSTMLDAMSDTLEFKLFHLDTNNILTLKAMAKMDGELDPRAITSFNVVIAHIWRCKVLATNEAHNENKKSTILYAVDIRQKLDPPLPLSYTGNAVLSAYASATCFDLKRSLFSRIVGMVREGAIRMNNEYIRSVIDWGELYTGFPHGDVFVSSWWKLGFAEVEFPWGKPIYSCPVIHPSRDIVLLFPSMDGADKGVNVLISLPKSNIEKFESLFYRPLDEM